MRKISEKSYKFWNLQFFKIKYTIFYRRTKKKIEEELINEKIKQLFKFKSKDYFKLFSLTSTRRRKWMISINDLPYLWYMIEIIPFLYKKGTM